MSTRRDSTSPRRRTGGTHSATRAVGGPALANAATPDVPAAPPLDLGRSARASPESFQEGAKPQAATREAWTARHQAALFPSTALYYEEPIELQRGEGQFVFDGDGNRCLDLCGGIVTVVSGHDTAEITGPIKEHLDRITHTSTFFLEVARSV